MDKEYIASPLKGLILSIQAALLGGILAGLVEMVLVTHLLTAPEQFSGLLFAIVAYGLLGGVLGAASYLALSLLPFHKEKRASRRELSAFMASLSAAIILFLIFAFRAFRDFHAENVAPASPFGLLTILVVMAGAVIIFFLFKALLLRGLQNCLAWVLKPLPYLLIIILLLIISAGLKASLSNENEEVFSDYSGKQQARLTDRPCLILIMVDTLRPDWLGGYGNKEVRTPNLDALARDGELFLQTYAQSNNTKPSTASLLTSRYLTEHQAVHKLSVLPDGILTLAEVLGSAGYYCGGIVTNINLAPIYNFQQGFHEYLYLPPTFLFGANESARRLVIYGALRQISMKLSHSFYVDNFYRAGETVTGYFDDFLNRNKAKKFFLFLHYMDPHDPYFEHPYNGKGYARVAMPNPDKKFVEPFKKNYTQEVEYMDACIGKVMDQLKSSGLYDQSMIVVTSDHGEEFYEHEGWWHGTTLHEEQIRVPLIIKRPAGKNAGKASKAIVNSIDVTPTMLNNAGLQIPPQMRGRVLNDSLEMPDVLLEAYSEADFEGNIGQALRIGPWKYILMDPENARKRPAEQLFYLPDDPHEQNNLAASNPEKAAELKALLLAKAKELAASKGERVQRTIDVATQERMRALGYTQ
jgi:arylsulfatase A-like enzyme